MQDLFDEYVEKVCSTCKGICNKGIYIVEGKERSVKCVNYVKDKNKVDKPQKHLKITAKKSKPIMKNIV